MRIVAFTDEHADAIVQWHYDPPYDFYDMATDPDEVDLVRNENTRGELRAVVDDGALVGYLNFLRRDEAHVGLGLRPDLTGRGVGQSFVQLGLSYAREEWLPERFRLWVAAFNARAITVYERVGFRRACTYCRVGDRIEFVEMERAA